MDIKPIRTELDYAEELKRIDYLMDFKKVLERGRGCMLGWYLRRATQ
jgi:hypothetical protein